ncbi:MAG: aldehyde dehydrogenase family protein [Bdellovibrionota bacterium]
MYRTVNPATGELVESFPLASHGEIERALDDAVAGFSVWRNQTLEQRADAFLLVADLLERDSQGYARLMAEEMGKVLAEGAAEVLRCAAACRYFAENAQTFLAPEPRSFGALDAQIRFEPLGVICAVMPWNFPFWQVFRCAAPAMMAGNALILKHAPNTPQCAIAIAKLFERVLPHRGIFQSLFLDNDQAARVISDRRVAGVSLTGSVRAGKEVGRVAGAHLKKMVLELGGSDPFIVLDDADVSATAAAAVGFRCFNNGQSCISPKRILVARQIFETFVDTFAKGMGNRVVGSPYVPSTQNGPLARADLRDALQDQVQRSTRSGARLLVGGRPLEGPGFYFHPTVLTVDADDNPAFSEELFGPVGVVRPFTDDDDLIRMANASSYGLGASIWTSNEQRARDLAPRLDVGTVIINDWVRSEPALPFGGIKDSGIGRELGLEGVREFTNIKTIWAKS